MKLVRLVDGLRSRVMMRVLDEGCAVRCVDVWFGIESERLMFLGLEYGGGWVGCDNSNRRPKVN